MQKNGSSKTGIEKRSKGCYMSFFLLSKLHTPKNEATVTGPRIKSVKEIMIKNGKGAERRIKGC